MRKLFLLLGSVLMVSGAFAVDKTADFLGTSAAGWSGSYSATATIDDWVDITVTNPGGFTWDAAATAPKAAAGWYAAQAAVVITAESNHLLRWSLLDGATSLAGSNGGSLGIQYKEESTLAPVVSTDVLGSATFHASPATPHSPVDMLRGTGALTISAQLQRNGLFDIPGTYTNPGGEGNIYTVSVTNSP